MSETPETATAPTEPTVATPTPPVLTPPAEPKATEPAATDGDDVPNVIKALRNDFKEERAKRQAAELEATNARTQLTNDIAKALGIVKDEPIDPAKLTESLTASQAEAKQARVELAVFRSAAAAGGDPAALLDSSSFLRSLDSIDPSDGAAVQAAIATAVEANSRLGAVTGPRPPAPNPAQGASASGVATPMQLTRSDVERLSAQGRHDEIDKARKAGQLDTLMGK